MIIYDLMCECGVKVEGWFKSLNDYKKQSKLHLLSCPSCHSKNIHKKVSAPYVNNDVEGVRKHKSPRRRYDSLASRPRGDVGQIVKTKRDYKISSKNSNITNKKNKLSNEQAILASKEIAEVLSRFLEMAIKSSEDVGGNFADEARKIHYNRAPVRQIRGESTIAELIELQEEGIECITLPIPAKKDMN